MFLIIAAILDKLYLSPDIQITVITILIVAVFATIVGGILAVPYFGREDNYLVWHAPQRDEPIDLSFHGGRSLETPLNYDPNSREDLEKIERGELVPRHDMALPLTQEKDLSDMFPELKRLGHKSVNLVHLRYHLHFRQRFDLSTGAEVVRGGVPFYHPHADEFNGIPAGVDYYNGVPYPVIEVSFSRKGDYEVLNNPDVMDKAFEAFAKSQLASEEPEPALEESAQPPAEPPAAQAPVSESKPGHPGKSRIIKE